MLCMETVWNTDFIISSSSYWNNYKVMSNVEIIFLYNVTMRLYLTEL